MKEVTIRIPEMKDIMGEDMAEIQQNMISKDLADKMAKEGVAIYMNMDSLSITPDGKSAVFNIYVVLGSEEDIKQAMKYYYPQEQ